MSGTNGALWTFFVTAALTVALALAAMAVFLVLSQRKTLALQRRFTGDLLRAQEEERAWVGRELHDDVVQHLVHLEHDMAAMGRGTADPEAAARLGALQGELDHLAEVIRNISHRLHPSTIRFGLAPTLTRLADSLAEEGLTVRTALPVEPTGLDPEAELALFRVAQEALRNVRRHAGADTADLTLTRANGQVTLEVRDQGAGFAPHRTRDGGIGLHSMHERMGLVHGSAVIISEPGQGTTVRATVSLPSPR